MTKPTAASTRPRGDDKGIPDLLGEIKDLVVTYAKQETVEPLKSLGRFIAYGLAGALVLSIGLVMLILGVLRLVQEEADDTFDGDWSWAPYLITLVIAVIAAGLAGRAIGAARRRAQKRSRSLS